MNLDVTNVFIMLFSSLIMVSALFFFVATLGPGTGLSRKEPLSGQKQELRILLVRREIVDISGDPSQFGEFSDWPLQTWHDLDRMFSWRFPSWPTSPPDSSMVLFAIGPDDLGRVTLEPKGANMHVVLSDPQGSAAACHALRFARRDAKRFQNALAMSPDPTWRIDKTGELGWSNAAFETLKDEVGDGGGPFVFSRLSLENAKSEPVRQELDVEGHKRWFDLRASVDGEQTLCHARDVSLQVAAETARLSFVQTLAKTFAHLSAGLAVFDKNQQLVLFNPALVDLTDLRVEFLSSRPDLSSFFDRLRDLQKVPEPKDYNAWRDRLSNLTQQSTEVDFTETWALPDSTTFRVTRRPHPEGAVAYLFEDISSEVLQTRRFRAELDLSQSALDALPDAIVVFSVLGDVVYANHSYRRLWGYDPESTLTDHGVQAAMAIWTGKCQPTPAWDRVIRAVQHSGDRQSWHSPIRLLDGRQAECHFAPLPNGNAMVRFHLRPALPESDQDAVQHKSGA